MTDQELRALVRAAVDRHFGAAAPSHSRPAPGHAPAPAPAGGPAPRVFSVIPLSPMSQYPSLVNPGDACVIEAHVTCDHCGFCKTHGY